MSSFREKMEVSFLERKSSGFRIREMEEAGKHLKKTKEKHIEEHISLHWDEDLWD